MPLSFLSSSSKPTAKTAEAPVSKADMNGLLRGAKQQTPDTITGKVPNEVKNPSIVSTEDQNVPSEPHLVGDSPAPLNKPLVEKLGAGRKIVKVEQQAPVAIALTGSNPRKRQYKVIPAKNLIRAPRVDAQSKDLEDKSESGPE